MVARFVGSISNKECEPMSCRIESREAHREVTAAAEAGSPGWCHRLESRMRAGELWKRSREVHREVTAAAEAGPPGWVPPTRVMSVSRCATESESRVAHQEVTAAAEAGPLGWCR